MSARRETLLAAGCLHGAALVALAVVVYLPVLSAGFIWDDDAYVERNETLRSVTGLMRIWFELDATPQYYPLVHTTYWIEYHLWGLTPAGYHLVNLLLHATSVVLVWRILLRLGVPGAWLAAAIFAVHPVGVESVAWITERKNVLSCALALGAILAYLRFEPPKAEPTDGAAVAGRDAHWGYYYASFALFALALLSKTVTVSVPAVLLVIYWWQRGRITRLDVAYLAPYFAAGIALASVTLWLERTHVGASGDEWNLSLVERVLIAGRAVWFYAAKLAWPYPLVFVYPRWTIDAHAWWQYLFPLAALAVIAVLWWQRGRIGRGPLAAVLVFCGVLVPAIGFFNVFPYRYSFVADHFQYHASIALMALAAAGVVLLWERFAVSRWALAAAGTAVIVPLAAMTWQRTHVYENLLTLYEDTLARNPDAWMAHQNLGVFFRDVENLPQEAIDHFQRAIAIREKLAAEHPTLGEYQDGLAELYVNLATAQGRAGQPADAEKSLEKAIALREKLTRDHPAVGRYLNQLAATCVDMGLLQLALSKPADAESWFQEAVELRRKLVRAFPNDVDYQDGLAWCYVDLAIAQNRDGRAADALKSHRLALEIREKLAAARPLDPKLQNQAAASFVDVGLLEQTLGRPEAAEQAFRRAIELRAKLIEDDPAPKYQDDLAGTYLNLAELERRTGRGDRAEADYQQAIKMLEQLANADPANAELRNRLAGVYVLLGILQHERGRPADAAASCRKSVELRRVLVREHPKSATYRAALGWSYTNLGAALLNSERVQEALAPCREAVAIREQLVRDFPEVAEHQSGLGWSYTNLALALTKSGQIDDAKTAYRNAINIRVRLLQWDPTVETYEHEIALACRDLANLLRTTGEIDEALTLYRTAVDIRDKLARNHPNDPGVQANRAVDLVLYADALGMHGDWAESAKWYARAVPAGNYSWQTMWASALAQLAAGDETAYRKACEELIARHGKAQDPDALAAIVLALVAGEKSVADMNQVVELAKRAELADPSDPACRILLGAAQYRAGQRKEAIVTLANVLSKLDAATEDDAKAPERMLSARLLGEALLALAYHEQTGRRVPKKRQDAWQQLVQTSTTPRPQPAAGFPPWAVRSTAEITEKELAQLESAPAAAK